MTLRNETRRRPRRGGERTGLLAALLVALATGGCGEPEPTGPPWHVLLISIDTIRADRLGFHDYFRDTSPVLDRLAKQSIVFDRAWSPIATTYPSHLSILTSTYPREHRSLGNVGDGGIAFQPRDGFRTWPDLLQRHGYQTIGVVSAAPLKPYTGINAGFDSFDFPPRAQWTAEKANEAIFRRLEERDPEKPVFLWAHYFDPHSPYKPPAEWLAKFPSDQRMRRYLEERDFVLDPDKRYRDAPRLSVTEVNDRYDAEVAYLDHHLGKLFDEFRAHDLWRNTIVVIVGDHGEGLGQHDDISHGGYWAEQLHVPFLVRMPGEKPRREEGLVSVVDVVPTVLGLADFPAAAEFLDQASGIDVLEKSHEYQYAEESSSGHRIGKDRRPVVSISDGRWRLLHDPQGEERLFDLTRDPFELEPSENEAEATRLRQALGALLAAQEERRAALAATAGESGGGDADSAAAVSPELLEQLRALGYAR